MARQIQITIQAQKTGPVIERLREINGVLGISLAAGAGIQPPGDILTVEATSGCLEEIIRLLAENGVVQEPDTSILISEPSGLISPSAADRITRDTSELLWEEMEFTLNKEGTMTLALLAIMGLSGFISVLGIMSGALHLVIGAMIIAPGFEPIIRFSLGVVTRSDAWKRGLHDVLTGYGALGVGAFFAAAVLQVYSPTGIWSDGLVNYWSSFSLTSLMVSGAASIAGTLLVASNRSVLTAGVMVALALVPSASLAGAELVAGNFENAFYAFLRWITDLMLVTGFSFLVFAWKRMRLHRRRMFL